MKRYALELFGYCVGFLSLLAKPRSPEEPIQAKFLVPALVPVIDTKQVQITDRSPNISSKLESSRSTIARTCQERARRSLPPDAARWDRCALSPR